MSPSAPSHGKAVQLLHRQASTERGATAWASQAMTPEPMSGHLEAQGSVAGRTSGVAAQRDVAPAARGSVQSYGSALKLTPASVPGGLSPAALPKEHAAAPGLVSGAAACSSAMRPAISPGARHQRQLQRRPVFCTDPGCGRRLAAQRGSCGRQPPLALQVPAHRLGEIVLKPKRSRLARGAR